MNKSTKAVVNAANIYIKENVTPLMGSIVGGNNDDIMWAMETSAAIIFLIEDIKENDSACQHYCQQVFSEEGSWDDRDMLTFYERKLRNAEDKLKQIINYN